MVRRRRGHGGDDPHAEVVSAREARARESAALPVGLTARSPLVRFVHPGLYGPTPPRVLLRERPLLLARQITGRAEAIAEARDLAARDLGLSGASHANSAGLGGGACALWLSPERLVLTAESETSAARLEALAERLEGIAHSWTARLDPGLCGLGIFGASAAEALMRGIAVDLDPTLFTVGALAQTRLGEVAVLLVRTADIAAEDLPDATGDESHPVPSYLLAVPRSYAAYIWEWLEDTARVFGCRVL